MMELEDKTDFVAQQAQGIAITFQRSAVYKNFAAIWLVETAEQMKQGAFAAARRPA